MQSARGDAADELGGGRVTGATNDDAVRGVDLAVLAVKADGALETARDVADALGDDAAPQRRERDPASRRASGMLPDPDALSLAERVQALVTAPVAAGLHSIAAANLEEDQPDEDALVCGDDERREGSSRSSSRTGSSAAARSTPGRSRAPAHSRD